MTLDELKAALYRLEHEDGMSKEDILKVSYMMYQDDELSLSDLRTVTELLGYEFTQEFEEMSEEDKKTKGLSNIDEE